MGIEDNFCVGCGKHSLGFALFDGGREMPCTYYDDAGKLTIIKKLSHLDDEHLNAVLDFYGYKPIKRAEGARP